MIRVADNQVGVLAWILLNKCMWFLLTLPGNERLYYKIKYVNVLCKLSVSIQTSRILEISDFIHKPSLLQFKNQTVMFG